MCVCVCACVRVCLCNTGDTLTRMSLFPLTKSWKAAVTCSLVFVFLKSLLTVPSSFWRAEDIIRGTLKVFIFLSSSTSLPGIFVQTRRMGQEDGTGGWDRRKEEREGVEGRLDERSRTIKVGGKEGGRDNIFLDICPYRGEGFSGSFLLTRTLSKI